MANTQAPEALAGLSDLAGAYRAVLCDVWGVVHNGVSVFPAARDALARFRAGGGAVVLITNAPRPRAPIRAQLDRLGMPRSAYDDLVTSGDVTRAALAGLDDPRLLHVGPARDLPLYEGLPVRLVEEDAAAAVSVTGLVDDERETPDDYAGRLARWAARGLPMICANPDVVVERGDRLVWCAGALAERYRALGGETVIAGKPHPPIYREAMKRIAGLLAEPPAPDAVLAIGDGAATDVRGANAQGLDVLFITAGIHAAFFAVPDAPRPGEVRRFLVEADAKARAYMARLAW